MSPAAQRLIWALGTFVFGATGFAYLGTWGGTGGPLTYFRGQLPPDIELPPAGSQPLGPPLDVRARLWGDRVVGRVSPRYLSVAIDTSQLVGGFWWDPEADRKERGTGTVPADPFDFDRAALDVLVRELRPAFLRVGGSEADKTHYDLRELEPDARTAHAPDGYESVLRLDQWVALQRFVRRHDLALVFTLNAGPSARDDDGAWRPDDAEHLLGTARKRGDRIAKLELGNEANLYWYVFGPWHAASARQYAEDLAVARELVDTYAPGAGLTGQSSAFWPVIGEPLAALFGLQADYLREGGSFVDHVAWHYYPQQSRRCLTASRRAHPTRLLEPQHLDEVRVWARANIAWRDRHAPGKKLWMGETGNAQCGGEPGVSDRFIASLWWLDQLGLLAREDHWVVVRQTLTGMDYGLLSEPELEPRPDYWASVLWKRLMGERVLGVSLEGLEPPMRVRVYAHCTSPTRGDPGSATLLALNLHPRRSVRLRLDRPARTWVVSSPVVTSTIVHLGGTPVELRRGVDGRLALPDLGPSATTDRPVVPPLAYGFFVLPDAASACGGEP